MIKLSLDKRFKKFEIVFKYYLNYYNTAAKTRINMTSRQPQ